MESKSRLFDQFPPVSYADWKRKLELDLKGTGADRLLWNTEDNIVLEPYYTSENQDLIHNPESVPGSFPFLRGWSGAEHGWRVREEMTASEASKAIVEVNDLLSKGVDSISLKLGGHLKNDQSQLEEFLGSLPLDKFEIIIQSPRPLQALTALLKISGLKGIQNDSLHGLVVYNPLGRLLVEGEKGGLTSEEYSMAADLVIQSGEFNNLRVIDINVSPVSDAGSGSVRELAIALAMGSEYIALLSESGIKPSDIYRRSSFTFGTGSNYFLEIAKYRAARMLWALIGREYGVSEKEMAPMYQHAVTSRWNMTLYDRYVNMLRSQTEAMSAAIGGVNAITVLPYNNLVTKEDRIAERIARNQQLLLLEESYFGKVKDPGAGSYYIEEMTSKVAEKAWEIFVNIESKGGFTKSVANGFIGELITESGKSKRKYVSEGKRKLLGTNVYPQPDEILTGSLSEESDIEPVVSAPRLADEIEQLRLSTERMKKRPVVFLVPMGNLAMRRARAQFASSFFGVAGYKVIDNHGFDNAGKASGAALKADADIIVLCSSDEEYAGFAKDFSEVKESVAIKVIAGGPANRDELAGYGFDRFITRRSDLLETLRSFNDLLISGI